VTGGRERSECTADWRRHRFVVSDRRDAEIGANVWLIIYITGRQG
jgi:hypothetical protein